MPKTGLFPEGRTRPTPSNAEQAMHAALAEGLPDGWTAWHSLRVRTKDGVEGEGDFVIAIPDRGVLILEVKGGSIEVRNGFWFQNGRPMERAPREQALSFMQKLMHKVRERYQGQLPRFEVATAFPDTAFSKGPTAGDVAETVLGRQHLPYLGDALPALVDRLFADRRAPRDRRWIDVLHALWGETWVPRIDLRTRVEMREAELVSLDEKQIALLDAFDHNDRLLVTGGPGTGKTLLAREMAFRLQARGRSPVFLCWTKPLAASLRASGLKEAWTIREIAARLIEKAGIEVQGGAPRSQWSAETWELAPLVAAVDAHPIVGDPYDAAVIDAAQDFTPSDWELARVLVADGPLWAFGDQAQGFWEDRIWPHDLFAVSFRLVNRYRCPEALARFADQYRPPHPDTPAPPPPDGAFDELRIVRAPSASAVDDKVALELQKAIGAGVDPGDIAVLSLGGQAKTHICSRSKIGGIAVVRGDDETAVDSVVADTFLRFKGLERPWIIVTELGLGESRYDVRMHVALTRATLGCVVVGTAEEIAADPRLSRAQ